MEPIETSARTAGKPADVLGFDSVPRSAALASWRMNEEADLGDRIHVGSAEVDGPLDGGWLLGHYKPPGVVRRSEAVEIKRGRHRRGEERAAWVTGERRTALLVLVNGRFRVESCAPMLHRGPTWSDGGGVRWWRGVSRLRA